MYPGGLSTRFATVFIATLMTLVIRPAAAQFAPPQGSTLSMEKLSRIDDFFKAKDATGRKPGAVVLIQCHGKPVYLEAFGKRDVGAGIAMTTDAIFPIHSVTKLSPVFQP